MNAYLVSAGADATALDSKGFNVIHRAAQQGHTLLIDYYLHARHLDINFTDKVRVPPLISLMLSLPFPNLCVCWLGCAEQDGRSALHWAAYSDFPITTEFLLKNGANNFAKDVEQCLPLHWAAIRGNTKVIHVLVRATAHSLALVSK